MAVQQTADQLLAAGVDPTAVATLQTDRPAVEARQFAAFLEKDPIVSASPWNADPEAPSAAPWNSDPESDPLALWDDEVLSKDLSFDPLEHYVAKGGAAAFDAKSASRLGKIRKGQEANRSFVGTAAEQLSNIPTAVPKIIAGVGKGIAAGLHAGVVNPLVQASALFGVDPGFLSEYEKLSEQQAAEALSGRVAETAGLVKSVGSLGKHIFRATGLSKSWKDMSDAEAFTAIIDEGEKERELRAMSQGDIPALSPIREELAAQGTPVRPEAVQEATEHGTLGWLAFGTGIRLGGEAVSAGLRGAGKLAPASVLSAAQKAEQLAALRVAKDAALKAQQAGPKNAATEAALRTAQENFQAAEAAVGESNLASAVDLANRARSAISSASTTVGQGVIGRPIQAAGAVAEGLAKLVTKTPRIYATAGAIGGLFVHPAAAIAGLAAKELVAPLVQKAGAAVKGYGKAVAEGQARRTLDVLGAVKDTAAGGLSQYPMDYAFAVGLSDTEQQARASAPIATALGVLPGAGRGVRRIVTGELITPKGAPTLKPSPAYGENKVLDATHSTAMKTVDSQTAAQINWVRELARKMGGRVYLMPDAATFESTLTEVWKQQHPGAEITPEIAASLKQAADQQGLAFGDFAAADGELQPTVFIKNPEAAVHEMGHILEKVLPAQVNARLDEQTLSRLSPENLEAAGTYYTKRLGRTEPWREVLASLNPEFTPEQYLAREMRAENLGVALKNRGEAFATSPGLYRWLAQTVAKIGDAQGIPLAQSESLGFPVFGDVMRASEKAAGKILGDEAGRELVQARDARLRAAAPVEVKTWAAKPATPETGAAEADRVTAWLQTANIPVANRATAAQTLAEALRNQQGVRLSYWGAKGEPGGDPAALRPERRAEIEAQRDAPNTDRDLVTKDYFPYGAIITSKGPQFKGWSPNNFNANVARFAEWIAAHPEAAKSLPLVHDLSTEAGQRGLQADLQTFVQNQQAGFTGSGRELVVPEGAGATQPIKTGVEPAILPQERADVISYLFNLKLPETPRITSGKIPLNIVGQRVSEATLPGRVIEPIRPRGEFTGPKAEALGIAGERVQEVNPFRQAVEQAAKDASTNPPELIEAAQILALDRIADATVAPELPAFGGNVLTLTAGFLPSERPSIKTAGEEILRMTPDEFIENSSKWPGGFSSEAKKIGLSAKSPEDVKLLRDFQKNVMEKSAAAMKAKDYNSVMALSNQSALFREAVEVATGVGGGADWMRKNAGESYTPPVPEGVAEATPVTTQALPKKPKNELKLLPAGREGVSKAWVLPGGKVEQLGGQWHHDWLDQNKDVQKKYGLEVPPFEGGDAEAVRESALKKGFARVNYSRNTGTLTVEARAKDWRKQKGAIERLVEENIDDIDNMTVHLLSEDVSKVVDSASERLFNFEDAEKMDNLPFITKGEVRGQFLPEGTPKERTEDLKQRGLFVGNKRPEGFLESVAPWEYWLSPDGDVFPVSGETMKHDSWARENIVGEDLPGKILNAVPVARDLGPERYAAQARKKGWLQVYVEPMVGDKGIFVTGKINASQKAVLEDLAFDKKLPVYDRNTDRVLIPSTSEFTSSQFLPSENKAFVEELRKIRKGESSGQTFNADGSIWQAPETPSDIVTLASTTIPREKLTGAEFEKATEPYQELLAQPNVAAGVFSFERGGKPVTSIDINAVVPQTFRENTLAFAKANDQVAIWDAAKNETVEAGGSGNTKITSPEQMRAAAEALVAGEEFQFLPAEQTSLPGISTGRKYDRKAIEGMSQAQLKEYFPEAIIPKKNTEFISDNIVGSPLAKAAGSKEAAVQAFADKLVRDYRSRENDPMIKAGEKWYSEFTPLLKKEFGKDSRIFAELLAATSPNNPPSQNFAFALDALRNWKSGKYDKMISKFNEGLNKLADGGLEKVYQRDLKAGKVKDPPEKPSDATYLAHWIDKNNLIPLGSSGKRFSMHSVPVLKVLARKWMTLNTGPKTDNFIKNLVGEGDEATVDLWAARSLRRLGYEGFQDRWRILPRNKTGVSDEDFVFSQQVFRKAADELGIKPSSLQGAMWFREKQLWSENGWGRLDLGDYKTEMERMPQLSAGFKSREARAKAEAKPPAAVQNELDISPR